jgi:uncharacterized protein
MKKDIQLQCPQCGGIVYWNNDYEYRPFCSQRCQLIDLNHWAEEKYAIESEPITDHRINDDKSEY